MSESIPPHSPELLAELEKDVGVRDGFFSSIIHEDDWSLIIKLHGLVEAGLNQVLIAHFDDSRLEDIFARMPVGGRIGKLGFIRALQLLPDHNIHYIQKLSEIRNSVVHKVANVSFSIEDHIRSLNHEQLVDLVRACADGIMAEEIDSSKPYEESQIKELFKNPRQSFWWSSVWVLGNITKSKRFQRASRQIDEIHQEAGRLLLRKEKSGGGGKSEAGPAGEG
jgi:hypothetical protein